VTAMRWAIPRYGIRVAPETSEIIRECRSRGQLIRGPQIAEFEESFAHFLGVEEAIATSYGRMAFYYILKAFRFPPGSEIVLPALTFWVIPELARAAGLKPVFADVDPVTFTTPASAIEQALTERTCAVVPTHLYGLPCDMDEILSVAARHHVAVIEDCAHAIGATYQGRPVGTLGDAALYSFQLLKPLSTFRGGMAIVRDKSVRERVRQLVNEEPWPAEATIQRVLRLAWLELLFTRPGVFTFSGFPILWLSSFLSARPDVYLWEPIRHLAPLPADYTERYSNVQAALGLAGLKHLAHWTATTRSHAEVLNTELGPVVRVPSVPPDRTHVYYQYCVYPPDRDVFVRQAIRRGIDVETLHMDVCTKLPLFAQYSCPAPGAEYASQAVQLPVYSCLSMSEIGRVADVARHLLSRRPEPLAGPGLVNR